MTNDMKNDKFEKDPTNFEKNTDDILRDAFNKYSKDAYNAVNNSDDEPVDKIYENPQNLGEYAVNWIFAHPLTFMTLIGCGTIFASYKLYEHLIANAVFKGNKKTIEYVARMNRKY